MESLIDKLVSEKGVHEYISLKTLNAAGLEVSSNEIPQYLQRFHNGSKDSYWSPAVAAWLTTRGLVSQDKIENKFVPASVFARIAGLKLGQVLGAKRDDMKPIAEQREYPAPDFYIPIDTIPLFFPQPLNDTSINELAGIYVRTRDEKTAEILFKEMKPIIDHMAYGFAAKAPEGSIFPDDLIEAGIVGLAEGLQKLDLSFKINNELYLRTRIKGKMRDSLRELDILPRSERTILKKMGEFEEEYMRQNAGSSPSSEEYLHYGKSIGLSEKIIERFLQGEIVQTYFNSIHATSMNEDSTDRYGVQKDNLEFHKELQIDSPLEGICRRELASQLATDILELPERLRLIVDSYFYENMNLQQIAESMNITESRVSQLIGTLSDNSNYFRRTKSYWQENRKMQGLEKIHILDLSRKS